MSYCISRPGREYMTMDTTGTETGMHHGIHQQQRIPLLQNTPTVLRGMTSVSRRFHIQKRLCVSTQLVPLILILFNLWGNTGETMHVRNSFLVRAEPIILRLPKQTSHQRKLSQSLGSSVPGADNMDGPSTKESPGGVDVESEQEPANQQDNNIVPPSIVCNTTVDIVDNWTDPSTHQREEQLLKMNATKDDHHSPMGKERTEMVATAVTVGTVAVAPPRLSTLRLPCWMLERSQREVGRLWNSVPWLDQLLHRQFLPRDTGTILLLVLVGLRALNHMRHSIHSWLPPEAVRRAVYFWKRATPILTHYVLAYQWLQCTNAPKERRDTVFRQLHNHYCQQVLEIVLSLRGLYVKLGQLLASRSDIIPRQYVELFEPLQDSIPPCPIDMIRKTISRALQQHHRGMAFEDVFESIDASAIGSSSIGQVHRAVLKDSMVHRLRVTEGYSGGNVVAVKVMHAGIQERFQHDFQVVRWMCRLALPDWTETLRELERDVMTEFDYQQEAASLSRVRAHVTASPYWDKIGIPEPIRSLCCREVLVMEMVHGPKLLTAIEQDVAEAFGDAGKAQEFIDQRKREVLSGKSSGNEFLWQSMGTVGKYKMFSLLRRCRRYIKLLIDTHGSQIFVEGCFNGDPQISDIILMDDGRLGLLDYGQARRLSSSERLGLAKVVAALGQDSDERVIANAMREFGFAIERNDDDAMMVKYAKIFFDSDEEGSSLGFATPHHYFNSLMAENPLTSIPNVAVYVAKISVLFRGMGSAIGGKYMRCSKRWWKHAYQALLEAGEDIDWLRSHRDATRLYY